MEEDLRGATALSMRLERASAFDDSTDLGGRMRKGAQRGRDEEFPD